MPRNPLHPEPLWAVLYVVLKQKLGFPRDSLRPNLVSICPPHISSPQYKFPVVSVDALGLGSHDLWVSRAPPVTVGKMDAGRL